MHLQTFQTNMPLSSALSPTVGVVSAAAANHYSQHLNQDLSGLSSGKNITSTGTKPYRIEPTQLVLSNDQ